MAEDFIAALARFHREVINPDIERIFDAKITPLRNEVLSFADHAFKRIERLEIEYDLIVAALRRLEAAVADVDKKLDRIAVRSELDELKERVRVLEDRIAELEAEL